MTTPIYNPGIPKPKDIIKTSQGDFQINFRTFYDAFLKNHIPLDALSNAGNHTILQLIRQNDNAQFQTDAGEISIYTKTFEAPTDQLFMRYQGNQDEFHYTAYQIYEIIATPQQSFFFTFLPGKILVYFGLIVPNSNTFDLLLLPELAKNIIGLNLCPIGSITTINHPLYPPNSNGVVETSPGIFGKISLITSFLDRPIPTCSYIVFANI